MNAKDLTPDVFASLLPSLCSRETSADPDNWGPENPLWGHCAVVALVAQNLFGGEIVRASLEHVPALAHVRSHYWNRFGDHEIDFTWEQFGAEPPTGLIAEVRTRHYLMSNLDMRRRYQLLAWRLARAVHAGNPLFDDEIYRRCFLAALASPCQKMRFGCVMTRGAEIVYEGGNKIIEPMRRLCEPTCIRLTITSRTESMIGACGHAEEWALWDLVERGIPLKECQLYVAGTHMNGLPWLKTEPVHTCLRCSVQMHHAKIAGVNVPVIDGWRRISTEQALQTAIDYATKAKSV